MAIVSFGPLVDGLRGSVGGVTFSQSYGVATVRAKPRPPRPVHASQANTQRLTAAAANAWALLSSGSRAPWDAYAATVDLTNGLGQTYHPTGMQCYIWRRVVSELIDAGSYSNSAPTNSGLAAVPTLTLGYSSHNIYLTAWDPAPNSSDRFLFSLSYPDTLLAHNRTRIFNRTQRLAGVGLPILLASTIDAGLDSGTTYRVHLFTRVIDYFDRPSIRNLTYLDFTASP